MARDTHRTLTRMPVFMTLYRNLRILPAAIALAAVLAAGFAQAQREPDVPYVPTADNVVVAMLKMAEVKSGDFVIDLGSGDGRIVIAAAKQFGARGVGIEIDATLINTARAEAERQGVAGRVTFVNENLFATDLSRATVITMYLFPSINLQLRPQLLALKPGTRIVSHDFDMGDWPHDGRLGLPVPNKSYGPPSSQIYFWVVPANAAGRWQWQVGGALAHRHFEMQIAQTFQKLEPKLTIDGVPVKVVDAKLRGTRLTFSAGFEYLGHETWYEFDGRIDGDEIEGHVHRRADKRESEIKWAAKRLQRGRIETGPREQ